MIICPICETEHSTAEQTECILCGGPLPETIDAPRAVDLEAADTPEELPAVQLETSEEPASVEAEVPSPHESSEHPAPETSASVGLQEPPPPGTLCLIVYFKRRPALYFPVLYDELLIGRTDPASNSYPDLDVTPYDPELAISRKHAYLYREGTNYFIYPISNSGTQVNQEMVDIGAKKKLKEGDVVILSGRLAIRFARIPNNRPT